MKMISSAQPCLESFIREAEECAGQCMGFAAMSTVFAVVLSVAQAVGEHSGELKSTTDKSLVNYFVRQMADRSWMVPRPPGKPLSEQDIATDLHHTRDSLAHQLSLPVHIGMINVESEAKQFFSDNPSVKRLVSVTEFVAAVKATVGDMTRKFPMAVLDVDPRGVRRLPAEQVFIMGDTTTVSASRAMPEE